MKNYAFLYLFVLALSSCEKGKSETDLRKNVEKIKKETPKSEPKGLFHNQKGKFVNPDALRDPGKLAETFGFQIKKIMDIFHFEMDNEVQVVLRGDGSEVFVKLTGPALSTAEGVKVGMTFTELKKAVPGLKCTAIAEAGPIEVQCVISKPFTVIFSGDYKKIEKLPPKPSLDEIAATLKDPHILRVEGLFDIIKAPKQATLVKRDQNILPAGVFYFRSNYTLCHHTKWSPSQCDTPTVAVIEGIYSEKNAREKLKALGMGTKFPVGYPLVVHTDELGLKEGKEKGIAIVLGLFADSGAAKKWAKKVAENSRVMPLLDYRDFSGNGKKVIRIRPGASVVGYKERPFKKEMDMVRPTKNSAKNEAICKVKAGTFVVVEGFVGYSDKAMPAVCKKGGNAVVHLHDTLLYTTVAKDRSGQDRAYQLSYVECDTPDFLSWSIDGNRIISKKGAVRHPMDGC